MHIARQKLTGFTDTWRRAAEAFCARGETKNNTHRLDAAVLVGGTGVLAMTAAFLAGGGAGIIALSCMAAGGGCLALSWPREEKMEPSRSALFKASLTMMGLAALGLSVCCELSERPYDKNLKLAIKQIFAGQKSFTADETGVDWMRGFGESVRNPVKATLVEKDDAYHLIVIQSDKAPPAVLPVVPDARSKSGYRLIERPLVPAKN